MTDLHDVIVRPVMSEKSYDLLSQNCYTFLVDVHANKSQIKNAVEEIFGVTVKDVRTLRRKGKMKRQGRTEGRTPNTKKAYVTLTEDSKSIPVFDNLAQ